MKSDARVRLFELFFFLCCLCGWMDGKEGAGRRGLEVVRD